MIGLPGTNDMMQAAQKVFDENMARDGMSYAPRGLIARMGKGDALTALRKVRIDNREHPKLFEAPRFETLKNCVTNKRGLQKVKV